MNVARIVVFVVTLGSGLTAALLAVQLVGGPSKPAAVAEAGPISAESVLVASRELPTGTKLSAGDFDWMPWPESGLNGVYIKRSARPNAIEELTGSMARQGLLSGEPVREERLLKSDRGFMSVILAPGMRAIAVEVKALSTAGGFVLPNDHVDVILTRASSNGAAGGDSHVTETILTNVRVLAIDQLVGDKTEPAVVARETATLELTPRQVETIAQAQQLGTISLALRSIRDAEQPVVEDDTGGAVRLVRAGVISRVTTQR